MAEITFRIPASRDTTFDSSAFEHSIGNRVHIANFGDAIIKDAQVIEEGQAVLITYVGGE